MKKWIKQLDDQDFKDLYSLVEELEAPPSSLYQRIIIESSGRKKARGSNRGSYLFAAVAAVLVVFIPLTYSLYMNDYKKKPAPSLEILFSTGEVAIIQNNRSSGTPLLESESESESEGVSEGGRLVTGEESRFAFREAGYRFQMEGAGDLEVRELDGKKIDLYLARGTLMAESGEGGKKKDLTILTSSLIIRPLGTRFLVMESEEQSWVAVESGKVMISFHDCETCPPHIIEPGNVFYYQGGGIRIERIPEEIEEVFQNRFVSPDDYMTPEPVASEEPLSSFPEKTPGVIYGDVEMVYTFQSRVTGLVKGSGCVIGVTRDALVCLEPDGAVRWEWRSPDGISCFNSLPVIYGTRLYISSSNSLLIMELSSGARRIIRAPSEVSKGFGIRAYKDKLYIPYPEGIFTFSPKGESFEGTLSYSVPFPVSPVFHENRLLGASFASGELLLYTLAGEEIRRALLDNPVMAPPLYNNRYIICGDIKGKIYIFSGDLELERTLQLPEAVNTLIDGPGNRIFAFVNNGLLYTIDPEGGSFEEGPQVDIKGEREVYFYKSPLLHSNKVFIGTDEGELMIIGLHGGMPVKRYPLSTEPVSCSSVAIETPWEEFIFTGTAGGKIFRIKEGRE